MKYCLFFTFLISQAVFAIDFTEKVTKTAAEHAHCSKENPCLIRIEKHDNGYYSVDVVKSVLITDYGVLRFTPSSLIVIFDREGNFIRSTPTP